MLMEEVLAGDVVLTLGAGNIWKTGEALLEELKKRGESP
jgi:hypothetical protein